MAVREQSPIFGLLTGGSGIEALGGIAGAILTILGLVGIVPVYTASIASIVIGGVTLFQGISVAAEFRRLAAGGTVSALEMGGGVTAELLGGTSAVVLGVLALLLIAPGILLPISAIVIGSTLSLSSGILERLSAVRGAMPVVGEAPRLSLGAAVGIQALLGLGVMVLGILALVGISSQVLTLAAFLAASVALLLSGAVAGSSTSGLSGR